MAGFGVSGYSEIRVNGSPNPPEVLPNPVVPGVQGHYPEIPIPLN